MKNQINNWFISPNGDNQEYISKFFSKITAQLIQDRGSTSYNELIPEITEDFSFINELEHSHDLEQILDKLSIIYKNSLNSSSPGYIGQMDSIPTIGAILGDLVTAGINNNMLTNEMSPFLTWLEQQMIQVFSKWFGFNTAAGGVMTSGGTLANIEALTVARNIKLNLKDGNLFTLNKQPVLFASEHSHSSIIKAGMLLGIGVNNVIKIKSDDMGKMSVPDLRDQITESIKNDKKPFAVVSTFGTTNSGSLDPVNEIQKTCDEFDLWHHIDAIYGGAIMLSEKQKHLFQKFEKADSVSFNPQKWMFVSKTCSILIFKNFEKLKDNFRIAAPYVKESKKINLGELGIQGSRQASVLKLWLSLYLIGKSSYADIIDFNITISQSFAKFIIENPNLELYNPPELNIILFRPKKSIGQSLQEHTSLISEFQNYLYKENKYVSPIQWEGQLWLKCIFLNPYFDTNELKALETLIENYF